MACVRMGLYHPGAEGKLGWAWAGGSDDLVEAWGLDAFVGDALRRAQSLHAPRGDGSMSSLSSLSSMDGGPGGGGGSAAAQRPAALSSQDFVATATASVDDEGATPSAISLRARLRNSPEGLAALRELRARQAAEAAAVEPLVKIEDPSLPATSGAFRVFVQQMELIEMAYVRALQLSAALAPPPPT